MTFFSGTRCPGLISLHHSPGRRTRFLHSGFVQHRQLFITRATGQRDLLACMTIAQCFCNSRSSFVDKILQTTVATKPQRYLSHLPLLAHCGSEHSMYCNTEIQAPLCPDVRVIQRIQNEFSVFFLLHVLCPLLEAYSELVLHRNQREEGE